MFQRASENRAGGLSNLFLLVVRSEESNWTTIFFSAQEKADSSDEGKESTSEAGADVQDATSSTKTKETGLGYEEKVVSI